MTLAGAGIAMTAPARAADGDSAVYQRASACVAVMKPRAAALAERYRAGDGSVKPELSKLTEAGFTFIGTAYKAGLRKAEADQMLAEAEAAQSKRPAAELARLFASCRAEGDRLLADSNSFERMIVKQQARARINKLVADKG